MNYVSFTYRRYALTGLMVSTTIMFAGCGLWLSPGSTSKTSLPSKTERSNPLHSPASERLMKSGALVIDVRSPEEFAEDHLTNAINIPYTKIKSSIAKAAPEHSRSIVLYCASGRRAEIARQDLVELGYTQVTNGGGIADLK